MKKIKIEINADMGEGFDLYSEEGSSLLMPYVTMVNIACGYHAGNDVLMDKTVELALKHGLAIGAHPGYPDKAGFGRQAMSFSIDTLRSQVLYQLGALNEIVKFRGGKLNHIKPHGALYHLAMEDKVLATMLAELVVSIDPTIKLVGMADSALMHAAEKHGLAFQREVFADRRYTESGQLVPRSEVGAVITNVAEGLKQIKGFIENTPEGIDTICVHGDNEESIAFAKAIYELIQV